MKRSERDEWVRALRSGEYPQATGYLMTVIGQTDTGEDVYGFCCLGVKCDLDVKAGRYGIVAQRPGRAKVKFAIDPPKEASASWSASWHDAMPGSAIVKAWGIDQEVADKLANMNDGENDHREGGPLTFAQIADWIDDDRNVPVEED